MAGKYNNLALNITDIDIERQIPPVFAIPGTWIPAIPTGMTR